MIQKLSRNLTLSAIFGFGCAANAIMAQDHPVESPTSTVSVVKVPARRFTFVEHVGPYWQLAQTINETRARIAGEHSRSPLIIRYETDPGRTQPQQLKVEIGYVLSDGDEPTAPFLIRTEPASTSITLTIDEPTVSPRTAYAQLKQWAMMHDLTLLGPMIELHFNIDRQGSAAPVTMLEFQMPLVPIDTTTVAEQSEPSPHPRPRSINSTPAIEAEPNHGTANGQLSVTDDSSKPADVPQSPQTPPSPGPSHPSVLDVEADKNVEWPDDADPDAQIAPAIRGDEIAPEPARAKAHGSEEASDDTSDTIESLFASGAYGQLASQLMPDRPTQSNATIIWLGQLSFRISAAAKGIQDQYPNDAEPLLQLSLALRSRHSRLAGARSLDTLKHVTVQIDAGSEASRAQLAQIMRRIDRLLAGIAFKQISPADANKEIVNLLTKTNNLFNMTTP